MDKNRSKEQDRIEELEAALHLDRALLRHTSEMLECARAEIARAKKILGERSVAFEPTSYALPGSPGKTVVFPTMGGSSVPLHALSHLIERDWCSQAVHVRVAFRDEVARYAISEFAFDQLMMTGALEERLAGEISRQLAQELVRIRGSQKLATETGRPS